MTETSPPGMFTQLAQDVAAGVQQLRQRLFSQEGEQRRRHSSAYDQSTLSPSSAVGDDSRTMTNALVIPLVNSHRPFPLPDDTYTDFLVVVYARNEQRHYDYHRRAVQDYIKPGIAEYRYTRCALLALSLDLRTTAAHINRFLQWRNYPGLSPMMSFDESAYLSLYGPLAPYEEDGSLRFPCDETRPVCRDGNRCLFTQALKDDIIRQLEELKTPTLKLGGVYFINNQFYDTFFQHEEWWTCPESTLWITMVIGKTLYKADEYADQSRIGDRVSKEDAEKIMRMFKRTAAEYLALLLQVNPVSSSVRALKVPAWLELPASFTRGDGEGEGDDDAGSGDVYCKPHVGDKPMGLDVLNMNGEGVFREKYAPIDDAGIGSSDLMSTVTDLAIPQLSSDQTSSWKQNYMEVNSTSNPCSLWTNPSLITLMDLNDMISSVDPTRKKVLSAEQFITTIMDPANAEFVTALKNAKSKTSTTNNNNNDVIQQVMRLYMLHRLAVANLEKHYGGSSIVSGKEHSTMYFIERWMNNNTLTFQNDVTHGHRTVDLLRVMVTAMHLHCLISDSQRETVVKELQAATQCLNWAYMYLNGTGLQTLLLSETPMWKATDRVDACQFLLPLYSYLARRAHAISEPFPPPGTSLFTVNEVIKLMETYLKQYTFIQGVYLTGKIDTSLLPPPPTLEGVLLNEPTPQELRERSDKIYADTLRRLEELKNLNLAPPLEPPEEYQPLPRIQDPATMDIIGGGGGDVASYLQVSSESMTEIGLLNLIAQHWPKIPRQHSETLLTVSIGVDMPMSDLKWTERQDNENHDSRTAFQQRLQPLITRLLEAHLPIPSQSVVVQFSHMLVIQLIGLVELATEWNCLNYEISVQQQLEVIVQQIVSKASVLTTPMLTCSTWIKFAVAISALVLHHENGNSIAQSRVRDFVQIQSYAVQTQVNNLIMGPLASESPVSWTEIALLDSLNHHLISLSMLMLEQSKPLDVLSQHIKTLIAPYLAQRLNPVTEQ